MNKYLIIPTQHFSGSIKGKKEISFEDLPWTVQRFLSANGSDITIGLDESSYIKTNTPMAEKKKSQRSRLIKFLGKFAKVKAILTGTLKTKSPINVVDQYQFLDEKYFSEDIYAFAEMYSIMVNLLAARGRRVIIPQKDYDLIRKRLSVAWRMGGEFQFSYTMLKICSEYGINQFAIDHIVCNKKYTPFMHQEQLMKRVEDITVTVKRKDVFDIEKDYYIYNPIKRPVELSKKAKSIGNALTNLGFTDKMVLGKAPALELAHRLKDICNGFEPISKVYTDEKGDEQREISFLPLDENPKLEELQELLEEIGTEENQVVVWCYRTNAFDSIAEMLEKNEITFVKYSGAESNKQKDEAEEKFMSGEARVFLANQDSAGFGLNCLANCDYMIWYSTGDSYEKHYQAMHRLLRGESKTPKFAYHIYVKNSIEERNIRALDAGEELMNDSNTKDKFLFV